MNRIIEFLIKWKVLIIILLIILITVLLILLKFDKSRDVVISNDDNENIINTNKGIISDVDYKGLHFNNISLVGNDGMFVFNADVKNNTNHDIEIEKFNIEFYDKDNKEIITILGYIGDKILPNSKTTVNATTSVDLSQAVTKKIVDFDEKKFG